MDEAGTLTIVAGIVKTSSTIVCAYSAGGTKDHPLNMAISVTAREGSFTVSGVADAAFRCIIVN